MLQRAQELFAMMFFSLSTPSSFLFCRVFLLSFGSLFSTLIVVPPNDVTVLYTLCCVSAKSSSLLCFLSHWDIFTVGVGVGFDHCNNTEVPRG